MQMNVREDPVSMLTHAWIWLGTIDASAKKAGLEKTVTRTSMIAWGSASMELHALIWSMTTTVPASLDTQVNVIYLQNLSYFYFLHIWCVISKHIKAHMGMFISHQCNQCQPNAWTLHDSLSMKSSAWTTSLYICIFILGW